MDALVHLPSQRTGTFLASGSINLVQHFWRKNSQEVSNKPLRRIETVMKSAKALEDISKRDFPALFDFVVDYTDLPHERFRFFFGNTLLQDEVRVIRRSAKAQEFTDRKDQPKP